MMEYVTPLHTGHGLVKGLDDVHVMFDLIAAKKPTMGGLDTETTGLHLTSDRPFVVVLGIVVDLDTHPHIHTWSLDLEQFEELSHMVLRLWLLLAKQFEYFVGHNIKYDMHMMANIGYDLREFNLIDSIACIRHAHDAVQTDKGGPPIQLKEYAARFIDPQAKRYAKAVEKDRENIARLFNIKLQQALNNAAPPPPGYRSWTLGAIDEFFSDALFESSDFKDPAIRMVYQAWFNHLPKRMQASVNGQVYTSDVPYNLVARNILLAYAEGDILFTLQILLKTLPVIEARQNQYALQMSRDIIVPFFDMERIGFSANKEYIYATQKRMKQYIIQQRKALSDIVGPISIGQHAKIKDWLNANGCALPSTGNEVLQQVKHTTTGIALRVIELVIELRTLEKWYSTYVLRFIQALKLSDRLYTQYNSEGAVSGRVTSDFQQFPKYPIQDCYGEELYHPRRIIQVSGGEYDSLIFLDYSQIELRVQDLYTILLGTPDLNLSRAYMPYQCVRQDGTAFDFNIQEHLDAWDDGGWYLIEDTAQKWTPIDLHGATTKIAFHIDENHPDYKKLRGKGKQVNFAKNYGATYKRLKAMFPDMPDEDVRALDEAYYKAFPSVKLYHNYCYNLANAAPYATNLFGAKYYGVQGHNLINMLVQGSSAYFLKDRIIAVYQYLKENKLRSRLVINVHDEIGIEHHIADDYTIFKDIAKIMTTWEGVPVPIVVEGEVTYTTWDAKQHLTL